VLVASRIFGSRKVDVAWMNGLIPSQSFGSAQE